MSTPRSPHDRPRARSSLGPSLLRRTLSPDASPLPYLIPTILFLALFLAYPIIKVMVESLYRDILIRPDLGRTFIGFGNYAALLSNTEVLRALRITALWTLLSVGGKTLFGFAAAMLLQHPFRGRRIYLTLLMVPWVTPVVIAAIAWRWVLDGQFGQLNGLLSALGVIPHPISWLGQQGTAFVATAAVDMWVGIPFMAMVLMAGLQSVPNELYEAAHIDGATAAQVFRHITLPMVRPILLVATLLSSVWTFNSFQVIWPLTRGGPAGATTTLVVRTFTTAFGSFDFGQAAALATFVFLLLTALSFGYWRLLQRGA